MSGAACSTRGVFSREAIAADAASNAQSSTPPVRFASHQNLDLPRDAIVQNAAVQRRAVRPAVLEELRDAPAPAVVGVQRAAPHLEAQARLVLLRRRDARAGRRARPFDCGRRRVSICSDVRRAPPSRPRPSFPLFPPLLLPWWRAGSRSWRPELKRCRTRHAVWPGSAAARSRCHRDLLGVGVVICRVLSQRELAATYCFTLRELLRLCGKFWCRVVPILQAQCTGVLSQSRLRLRPTAGRRLGSAAPLHPFRTYWPIFACTGVDKFSTNLQTCEEFQRPRAR